MALVENVRVSAEYVRWKRNAADTVNRTVADYIMNPSAVADWGAVGDGVTDDSDAFAKAILNLPEGSTLDLGGKTYVASVVVNKKMRIQNGTVLPSKTSAVEGGLYITANGCLVDGVSTFVDMGNLSAYTAENVSGIVGVGVTGLVIRNCSAIGSKCNRYDAVSSWGVCIGAYNSSDVVITDCQVDTSHKEALMTRMCNRVFISDCQGANSGAGFSNIGTSGGDVAIIAYCYSKNSGATGITMNNGTSIVIGCINEGNKNFNGILIGHNHESQQWAGTCGVLDCIVRNSFGAGISIDTPLRTQVSNCLVENTGTGDAGAGHGIIVSNMQSGAFVMVADNTVRGAGSNGVRVTMGSGTACDITVRANNIHTAALHGINITNNLNTTVDGNAIRNITGNAILVWNSVNTARGVVCSIRNNDMNGIVQAPLSIRGQQFVNLKGNTYSNFNASGNASNGAVMLLGTDGTNSHELPDAVHVVGESFLGGSIGSSAGTINASTDGLSNTKQLIVQSCYFSNSTRPPVSASARYQVQWGSNKRGADPTLVTVSVPGSGTLVVSNTNQTSVGMPNVVPRDSAAVSVALQSYADGTLTLQNYSSNPAGVTLAW